jgi:hypothetical protein
MVRSLPNRPQRLALWKTCFTHALSQMLSSAASLNLNARWRIPPRKRRASLQRNLNLFDLVLKEIHVWETLENEHKALAIEILARLIANAAADNHNQEENHE